MSGSPLLMVLRARDLTETDAAPVPCFALADDSIDTDDNAGVEPVPPLQAAKVRKSATEPMVRTEIAFTVSEPS
jgi:hypothetical protein